MLLLFQQQVNNYFVFILLGAESKYLLSNFRKHRSDFLLLCVMNIVKLTLIGRIRQRIPINIIQWNRHLRLQSVTQVEDPSGGAWGSTLTYFSINNTDHTHF